MLVNSIFSFFLQCFQTLVEIQMFNPFPNDKFETFPNWKSLQMTILSLMKMMESSPNGWKTLWEKEKLLVTSNFSLSCSVFKRLVLQTRKNQGLFGKGLSHINLPSANAFNLETSKISSWGEGFSFVKWDFSVKYGRLVKLTVTILYKSPLVLH